MLLLEGPHGWKYGGMRSRLEAEYGTTVNSKFKMASALHTLVCSLALSQRSNTSDISLVGWTKWWPAFRLSHVSILWSEFIALSLGKTLTRTTPFSSHKTLTTIFPGDGALLTSYSVLPTVKQYNDIHSSFTIHSEQMFINASQLLTFRKQKFYQCSLFQLCVNSAILESTMLLPSVKWNSCED